MERVLIHLDSAPVMPLTRSGPLGDQNGPNISSVDTSANTITFSVAHNLGVGQKVKFVNTGGALPAPLATGTVYYVISSAFTFFVIKVSTTLSGAEVDLTTVGTGTNTVVYTDQYGIQQGDPGIVDYWATISELSVAVPDTGGSFIGGF
jgi:hypothetical protein